MIANWSVRRSSAFLQLSAKKSIENVSSNGISTCLPSRYPKFSNRSAIGSTLSASCSLSHIHRKSFSTSSSLSYASPWVDSRPTDRTISQREANDVITPELKPVEPQKTQETSSKLSKEVTPQALINRSFYRRSLPPHLTSFESPEGKQRFKRCLTQHTAEPYFHLAGNFTLQSDPAYCGPATLAMVLNSLEVDPNRQWKGVWRWWSDEMLECAPPSDVLRKRGVSFGDFAGLARCNGLDVTSKRGDKVSYEEFMKDVTRTCTQSIDRQHFASEDWEERGGYQVFVQQTPHEEELMVVNFSRKVLGQTGDGHFSTLAAYDETTDSILVLDVARFKYPSYFVPSRLLYDSLAPIDKETGQPRGYFLLKRGNRKPTSMCSVIEGAHANESNALHKLVMETLPSEFSTVGQLIESGSLSPQRHLQNVEWVARTILRAWPEEYHFLLTTPSTDAPKVDRQQLLYEQKELLAECMESPLYPIVEAILSKDATLIPLPEVEGVSKEELHTRTSALATMLLMALPESLFHNLSPTLQTFFIEARPTIKTPLLKLEVERMRDQISVLMHDFCGCGRSKGEQEDGSVAWINLSRLAKY